MEEEKIETFADRLNMVKRLRNLTLENIAAGVSDSLKERGAARSSITKAAVHRWTSGETEPQNRMMWQALADFLNEDLSWLQNGVRANTTALSRRIARKIAGLSSEHQKALESIIDSLKE